VNAVAVAAGATFSSGISISIDAASCVDEKNGRREAPDSH
jgi:hypothetical protein